MQNGRHFCDENVELFKFHCMKVCFVLASDEEGGLENHVLDLCQELTVLGLEVLLIAPERFKSKCCKSVLFKAFNFSGSRRNFISLYKLCAAIRICKADIVHAHGCKAASMLAIIHRWIPGYRIATNHGYKKKFPRYPGIQAVVGVSETILKPIRHPNKILIHNGAPPYTGPLIGRQECNLRWGLRDDLPLTLAAGRLVAVKGYDVLIHSWRKEFGYLLICGEGPEFERLKQLIKKLDLDRYIKLVGFQRYFRGIIRCANLVVFSSHREGFSYVLIEALLSKVPVVSTKVPGALEVLPENQLAEINDSKSLAHAIERCLFRYQQCLDDMEPVFEWAKNNLTVRQMALKIKRLYEDSIIH